MSAWNRARPDGAGRPTRTGIWAVATLLLVLLAVVAAGCGGSDSGAGGAGGGSAADQKVASLPECSTDAIVSPPKPDVSGTVNTVMEEVTDLDVVKKLIPAFNKAYPNVKINIEGANYDVIREKEIASFQKDEGTYDLMQVDTAWIPEFAEAGFLADLGPAIACLGPEYAYDDFSASFREIGQAGGKVYGVPFYSYPTGFIYRKDQWKTPPATLDDLVAGAKERTTGSEAGIALQPKQGQVIVEEFNAFLLAAGGQMRAEDGTWTVDTPEAKRALEAYIDLYGDAAPKNSLNWGFDETIRAAGSGKASALTTYGWVVPIVNAKGNAQAGKFALAPFPGGRGTGGAWQWSIPANAKAKDAAWAWISWITAKAQDKQRTILGGAPIRDSTMDDPEVWQKSGLGEDYYKTYKEIAAKAVPICRGTGCAEATEQIGVALSSAVAGTTSVEDALAQAQSDAENATG